MLIELEKHETRRVGDQVQSTYPRPHAIRGTGGITFAKPWSRRTLPRLRGGQVAHPAHTRLRPFVKLLWAPRHHVLLHSQQGTLRQHRGVVVIRGEVSAGGLVGVCGRVPSSHGKGDFWPQHVRASGTRRQLQVRECVSNERPDSNQRTGLQMTAGECVDTGWNKKSFWARFQDFCQSGESISTKWPADGSKTQQMSQETAGRSDETLSSRCIAEMPVGSIPVSI